MASTNLDSISISVSPRSEYATSRALFDALESIFPVHFQGCDITEIAACSAAILIGESLDRTLQAAAKGIRCYRVPSRTDSRVQASGRIEFGTSLAVHRVFRGAKTYDPSIRAIAAACSQAGDVLASVDGRPVWTAAGSIQDVAVDLPVLGSTERLRQHFLTSRWLMLLPLLHFLRAESSPIRWSRAEIDASFIIDDPNLHSTRYGCVDFEALALHARTHRYHAAIATVPLDTWHVSSKAASIFRENAKQLSILIHGVNHTKNELACFNGLPEMQRLLATGLMRIRDFERRSGASVCKVMVPPHGAFSVKAANGMGELGYEAACVSYGSLLHWNRDRHWPSHFGFALGQFLGPSKFPVFHRIALDETDVRLCIFLEHPVVMTSHHQDLSSGMQKFSSLSQLVNSFGQINWNNLTAISRSNYLTRKKGTTMQVRPYTRRILLKIPSDVSQLSFSLPWSSLTVALERRENGMIRNLHPDGTAPVELLEIAPGRLEVCFPQAASNPVSAARTDKPGTWPVVRRVLTESRDRLWPMLHAGG